MTKVRKCILYLGNISCINEIKIYANNIAEIYLNLVIRELCQFSSSVSGGENMILLCDKVAKDDIQINFFEEQNGVRCWEEYATFDPSDVYKQVREIIIVYLQIIYSILILIEDGIVCLPCNVIFCRQRLHSKHPSFINRIWRNRCKYTSNLKDHQMVLRVIRYRFKCYHYLLVNLIFIKNCFSREEINCYARSVQRFIKDFQ